MNRNISIRSILALALAWTLTACSSVLSEEQLHRLHVYASLEQEPQTRTVIDLSDSPMIRWSEGDEISLLAGDANLCYRLSGEEEARADFVCAGDNDEPIDAPLLFAVYPYSSDNALAGNSLRLTFPAVQTYRKDSFSPGSAPMVAQASNSDEVSFRFMPVCGYLRLRLWNRETVSVRSIRLKAEEGVGIAGQALASFEGEVPVIEMSEDATDIVTLDCGVDGVALGNSEDAATTFWFCLPPVEMSGGFSIEVTATDGKVYTKTASAARSVSRNVIQSMSPLELDFYNQKRKYDRVMILFSAGFNSLSASLAEDIEDLKDGYVPKQSDNEAIVIVKHQPVSNYNYKTRTKPQLIHMYKDKEGEVVTRVLKSYPYGTVMADAGTMNGMLNDVKTLFPSESYGLIFSSHASGWLPPDFYSSTVSYSPFGASQGLAPFLGYDGFPDGPLVKSIGSSGSNLHSQEMDLIDFANSIPMHLDYLVLDACLTGCVEVAYELKDVCDVISFSPAEVMGDGMVYSKISSHLLRDYADVVSAAEDYYYYYRNHSEAYMRSATISVVDCSKLETLADVCGDIFSKYSEEISKIDPSTVQGYFRDSEHWFYDLLDIVVKAGVGSYYEAVLERALDGCILYKAATDEIMPESDGFPITCYSGLSMYLPCNGSSYLDEYYRTLAWNQATGLVP